MQIGFIGVGAMGGGLARNLIRAGKQVLVYDLNPEAVNKTLEAGSTGKAATQLQELPRPISFSPVCRCPSIWKKPCWAKPACSTR